MKKQLLAVLLTALFGSTYAQQIRNVDVLDSGGNPINGSIEICEGGTVKIGFQATGFCANTKFRIDLIDPGQQNSPISSITVATSPSSIPLDNGSGNNRLIRITSIAPAGCNDPERSGSTRPIQFIRFTVDMVAVSGANSIQTSGTLGATIQQDLQNGNILIYAAPRFWTMRVNACPGTSATALRLTSPNGIAYSAVENVSPWFLFGNEALSRLWTINDPTWGINSTYTSGFPTGVYSLSISLRDQQSTPLTSYPKQRTAQGAVVGSKTVAFEIQAPGARIGRADKSELSVRAWPNPTTDRLTVAIPAFEAELFSVRLIDLGGRPVYEKSAVATSASHQEEISLSQQPTGTYLLQVTTPQGIRMAKIMKTSY